MNWILGPKKRIKIDIFWNEVLADGKSENPMEWIWNQGTFLGSKKDKKLYFLNKIYRKKMEIYWGPIYNCWRLYFGFKKEGQKRIKKWSKNDQKRDKNDILRWNSNKIRNKCHAWVKKRQILDKKTIKFLDTNLQLLAAY